MKTTSMIANDGKDAKPLTRIERARIVRAAVLEISLSHGRWDEGRAGAADQARTARLWIVDSGLGWEAWVSTRFTRPAFVPSERDLYLSALNGLALPVDADRTIDVIWKAYGKVVSISNIGDVDTLIGFTPGPWEAAFGLPERAWSPGIARRLAKRSA